MKPRWIPECGVGRVEEAMELFHRLTKLPEDTPDLEEIIDRAGTFFIEAGDYQRAHELFETAVEAQPNSALFHSALGYCHSKLGDNHRALFFARQAVELDPLSHEMLSNLGWALIQTEEYHEAEGVLIRAVSLSPPDYETAQGNLDYLRSLR